MATLTGAAYVDFARSSLPRPGPAAQDIDREAATRRPCKGSADGLKPLSAIPEIPEQYNRDRGCLREVEAVPVRDVLLRAEVVPDLCHGRTEGRAVPR